MASAAAFQALRLPLASVSAARASTSHAQHQTVDHAPVFSRRTITECSRHNQQFTSKRNQNLTSEFLSSYSNRDCCSARRSCFYGGDVRGSSSVGRMHFTQRQASRFTASASVLDDAPLKPSKSSGAHGDRQPRLFKGLKAVEFQHPLDRQVGARHRSNQTNGAV